MSLEDRRKLENKAGIRGYDPVSGIEAQVIHRDRRGNPTFAIVDGQGVFGEEIDQAAARMVMYIELGQEKPRDFTRKNRKTIPQRIG